MAKTFIFHGFGGPRFSIAEHDAHHGWHGSTALEWGASVDFTQFFHDHHSSGMLRMQTPSERSTPNKWLEHSDCWITKWWIPGLFWCFCSNLETRNLEGIVLVNPTFFKVVLVCLQITKPAGTCTILREPQHTHGTCPRHPQTPKWFENSFRTTICWGCSRGCKSLRMILVRFCKTLPITYPYHLTSSLHGGNSHQFCPGL